MSYDRIIAFIAITPDGRFLVRGGAKDTKSRKTTGTTVTLLPYCLFTTQASCEQAIKRHQRKHPRQKFRIQRIEFTPKDSHTLLEVLEEQARDTSTETQLTGKPTKPGTH